MEGDINIKSFGGSIERTRLLSLHCVSSNSKMSVGIGRLKRVEWYPLFQEFQNVKIYPFYHNEFEF